MNLTTLLRKLLSHLRKTLLLWRPATHNLKKQLSKHMCFTMNSARLSQNKIFAMNYVFCLLVGVTFSKATFFTMNYALFFKKKHSFYNELYTLRLGAILGPCWHREGSMPEPSRAHQPTRVGCFGQHPGPINHP